MKIVVVFKNGFMLPITCDECEITTGDLLGDIRGFNFKGIKDNKPLFIKWEDVTLVYRAG